jgi:poly(A) polymerase/tRNA nucleotidyltransferase (CCA-adding enzyme)
VLAHTINALRWLVVVEDTVWNDRDTVEDGWRQTMLAAIAPNRQALQAHFNRRVDGGLDGRTLLRLGALFHDCGKKATRTIDADGRIRFFDHEQVGAKLAAARLGALALSNEAIGHIRLIIENHMRPLLLANTNTSPSRRAIYRYFRSCKSAGLDVALHALADHLAKYDGSGPEEEWQPLCAVASELLGSYFAAYEEVIVPPRLVDGKTLMDALGLTPGPEVGRLLSLIQEAQAAGEVADPEEALILARREFARSGKP